MRKVFLLHMGSALDAIKKKGYFKAHKEANKAYVEQCELVKQAKATLAKLDGTTSKGTETSKKPFKRHKEAAATADTPESDLQAKYQSDLKKVKHAAEKAKNKAELAAQEMLQLYLNLLSIDAKYAWNKMVQVQTQADPYMDLQGISRKGPRGYSCKAFKDCAIFHFSPCSPTTQLSRRGTTSQTCSRNSSASACVSLCSVWSTQALTLYNNHAATTVPVPSPVQFLQMYHERGLVPGALGSSSSNGA
jgi:hypothetical protein